jgi:N-acetylglutamate synthase-like GNAT family acetyltransferase
MSASGGVAYRPGKLIDTPLLVSTMAKELMNPLGIDHKRFLVATLKDAPIGFGQIRELGDNQLWELASLFVLPDHRSAGVGSALVHRLLDLHKAAGRPLESVYLLTLAPTIPFYKRNGFIRCTEDEVPSAMAFEVAAGSAISAILGNKLVCMRYGGSVRGG